ncbi:hypothetical protein MLD38_017094 [Melastoma candidum]|uniref:Uncharacterized protein n=1 Tax=Melastoma candidum TaxID=119954 RepID=A0ACB9QNW9_9MYRT|nr:hypothetical protein MLD38_017094 [Melastoma candidum]
MKIRAPSFLKHVILILTSLTKSKTAVVKNKAGAAKARLLMFSLAHSKRTLFASITNKFHDLLGHLEEDSADDEDDESRMKAIVVHAGGDDEGMDLNAYEADDDDRHNRARLSLSSAIDGVKDPGEGAELENEIDRVADVFIRRFHRQMRLQKLESFKRLQEMLQRGV